MFWSSLWSVALISRSSSGSLGLRSGLPMVDNEGSRKNGGYVGQLVKRSSNFHAQEARVTSDLASTYIYIFSVLSYIV